MIVKSHHGALKLLSQTKASNYGIIIKNTPDMAKALKILCRYILNGTIKLQDKHVKRLKPHRKFIRRISASSHKAIKTKVELRLLQAGIKVGDIYTGQYIPKLISPYKCSKSGIISILSIIIIQ